MTLFVSKTHNLLCIKLSSKKKREKSNWAPLKFKLDFELFRNFKCNKFSSSLNYWNWFKEKTSLEFYMIFIKVKCRRTRQCHVETVGSAITSNYFFSFHFEHKKIYEMKFPTVKDWENLTIRKKASNFHENPLPSFIQLKKAFFWKRIIFHSILRIFSYIHAILWYITSHNVIWYENKLMD